MNGKAKSNSVITHSVEGDVITFEVKGAGALTFNVHSASKECQQRATVHGFIQRISDAAAISRDPETGKPASPLDKLAAMEALVKHYESGTTEWGRKREGGGVAEGSGLLFQCLTKLYPQKSTEALREFLKSKSRQEKAALLASPKVRAVADSIRAEAGKGVDVEGLLAGL